MGNIKRRYRKNSERRIYVRGERHDPPDTYLLARALLDLAAEMAAAQTEPPQSGPNITHDTSPPERQP
ncbi:hypothetical protein [Nocardia sp. alder85J]|uniref:hypothetical protein n=1 Tax=Nocardia sp. alder85J TaxID=2862949 RepID=UPI001CD2721F|nr:hypothetical protein [Nocardia sp. alder85J]MCX4098057.1 hypothetical protein [Nocardia sp. alder85J]